MKFIIFQLFFIPFMIRYHLYEYTIFPRYEVYDDKMEQYTAYEDASFLTKIKMHVVTMFSLYTYFRFKDHPEDCEGCEKCDTYDDDEYDDDDC